MKDIPVLLLGFVGQVLCAAPQGSNPGVDATAREILEATGIGGGLILHIGCGDGRLTAALRAGDGFLVHGLDADAKNVDAARQHIRSLDLYGKVSVERCAGARLPHAADTVNLVVSEDPGGVPDDEVMRVLVPNGVAYVKSGGRWAKTIKPRPRDMDDWTHFLHGPDNNAVSRDRLVDQPRHLQWFSGPTSTRSHDNLASLSALVSSGGRIFCIQDEGSISAVALPTKWTLVARDAFNGLLLWKRPMEDWEGHLRGFRSGPSELPRRLIAIGDRVYVTLGYGKPITALDAATGKTVITFAGTENALEMICSDGALIAVVGDRSPDNTGGAAMPKQPGDGPEGGSPFGAKGGFPLFRVTPPKKSLMAFDALSGAPLWRKADDDTVNLMPLALAAAGGRVFFHNPSELIALEQKSGKPLWRAPRPLTQRRPEWSAPTLVACGEVVLSGDRTTSEATPEPGAEWLSDSAGGLSPPGELIAFSSANGKRLWSCPCRESYNAPPDVLVTDGIVWTGELVRSKEPGITQGRDLKTGEVVRERPADQSQFKIVMGHHRCYRNKATDRFLILGRDGIEFIDVATGEGEANHWTRGTCQYGVMPCNGLVYTPPHSCACHIEVKLNGFCTYAPESAERGVRPAPDESRLERGPVFEAIEAPESRPATAGNWPTYRGDTQRSGRAGAPLPTRLDALWSSQLPRAGRLSSPVAAGGRVFVAGVDDHTIYALDAKTGKRQWDFTAGGRVDSPPTIHGGLVLFGCADGRIYCLRASDGRLAWRFLAAPEDRRIVSLGQLESPWPVSGSVLIQDGVLFAVAGRCSYIDDGLFLCRLDPRTGRKLSLAKIEEPSLPDILSGDGSSVFMRHVRFDKEGAVQPEAISHLYSPAGFLDASWWHRTYWLIGTKMGSAYGGWMRSGNQNPSGRLIVQDGNTAYCFGLLNSYNNNKHVGLGATRYRLFSCDAAAGPVVSAQADESAPAIRVANRKAAAKKGKAKAPEKNLAARWELSVPMQVRAMVLGGPTLAVAGPPDFFGPDETISSADNPYFLRDRQRLAEQDAAMAGNRGALLWTVSATDGKKLGELKLDSPPVFDGMICADGRVFIATMDGRVTCLGK